MLKALIFDVDGTLADTEAVHLRAFNQAFEQEGLDWHWTLAQYTELLAISGGRESAAVKPRAAPSTRRRACESSARCTAGSWKEIMAERGAYGTRGIHRKAIANGLEAGASCLVVRGAASSFLPCFPRSP